MPLRLEPPKKGRTPNYRIRGTYLRVKVDQTAGTARKDVALKIKRSIEEKIERGEFAGPRELDFMTATISYLDAGGDNRFTKPLTAHFGETPLSKITQADIDAAAIALYPDASPATRNRQVYTPVSAILRHAGVIIVMKRPKGGQGKKRLDWLTVEQATKLRAAATELNPRFGALLTFLFYTGCRLSEALNLEPKDVNLSESFALCRETKNDEPRPVHLPPVIIAALANLDLTGRTVFGYAKSGRIYLLLSVAAAKAGVEIPPGVAFHICRHSWATWMRRHVGLKANELVDTGAWKSESQAKRYAHVDTSDTARLADLLPTEAPGVQKTCNENTKSNKSIA